MKNVLNPIAIVVGAFAVVACGPMASSVKVEQAPRSVVSQALNSCREQMPRAHVQKVSGANRRFSICEMTTDEPADATVSGTDPANPQATPPRHYETVYHDLRFGVSNVQGRITFQLSVALDLPQGTTSRAAEGVLRTINDICLPKIRTIFERSVYGQRVGLDMRIAVPQPGAALGANDQVLRLTALAPEQALGRGAMVMAQWPERGVLRPEGLTTRNEQCSQIHQPAAKDECRTKARDEANLDFCADLAQMTGLWLGLEASEELSRPCADPALAVVPDVQTATARESFMNPPRSVGTAAEYFARSKLSFDDLKRVLTPVCGSIATAQLPPSSQPSPAPPLTPAPPTLPAAPAEPASP